MWLFIRAKAQYEAAVMFLYGCVFKTACLVRKYTKYTITYLQLHSSYIRKKTELEKLRQ